MNNLPCCIKGLILLFQLFICMYELHAQNKEIHGIVRDSLSLTPIAGVIVKTLDVNEKTVSFTTTNKEGEYKLILAPQKIPQRIVFHLLSYADAEKDVQLIDTLHRLDVVLTPRNVNLREVIIATPDIILKKDTLSYSVTAFQQGSDRTIEDVLKRMPGISVARDGKISYQGKNISKFNIEGLDVLGGKYTLASTNIQAKDVNRVEVIENYQEIKQLQGKEYSDEVALDLKLKEEAKMSLLVNIEGGGGIRTDESLYHGAITGMTFKPNVQFIGMAKTNNFGSRLSRETMDHFGEAFTSNIANTAMDRNPSRYPPLASRQFQKKNEQVASLNSIVKTSDSETFRISADYNRGKSSFIYQTVNTYMLDGSSVVINEKNRPDFLTNSLKAGIKYQLNSAKIFIENTIFFYTRNDDDHFKITSNYNPINQDKTNRLTTVCNKFSFLKKKEKRYYNFNSTINYSYLPNYRIIFTRIPEVSDDFYQEGYGKTFSTTNNTSYAYDLSRESKLSLTLALNVDYDKIHTLLNKSDTTFLNKNDGYKITTSASLDYRLLTLDKRYGLTLRMPFLVYILDYNNRINSEANFKNNYLYINPSLNAHCIFSGFTKMEMESGYNNRIGDLSDFLLNPIQLSYNQQSTKAGILLSNQTFYSSLKFEYKNPLKLFFANGRISYRNIFRNILSSQSIASNNNDADINSSNIAKNNISHNLSFNGFVSKRVKSIATTISLDTDYQISIGSQIRQDIKMSTQNNNLSIVPKIETQIIKRFDLHYQITYSRLFYKSDEASSVYHQQLHYIRAEYNFMKNLFLHISANFNRKEITEKNYVNVYLLDAGAKYKNKKFEIELKLNNLLNTKEYSYTTHIDLDRFSYTYKLNPFEGILVCRFNL